MYLEVNNKLNEMIELLNKDKVVVELKKLKSEIYNDKHLMNLIERYNNSSLTSYDLKMIELKKEILENKMIIKYKKLEREINNMIFYINSELKKITDKGRC